MSSVKKAMITCIVVSEEDDHVHLNVKDSTKLFESVLQSRPGKSRIDLRLMPKFSGQSQEDADNFMLRFSRFGQVND